MSVNPNVVFYHGGCRDGFCAAWVASLVLGRDARFIPCNYGPPPPLDIAAGKDIYVLDFSWKRAEMLALRGVTRTLTVLDHHKTAQAELDGLDFAHFDMTQSGGALAWEHFFPMLTNAVLDRGPMDALSLSRRPWLVDYTEDRDLWKHALPGTHAINACLRSFPFDFELWDRFHHDGYHSFVASGAAILRAETQIVEDHVKRAVPHSIAGNIVLACNATVLFSEIAGRLAEKSAFGACYFDRADGLRQWSLRSRDSGVDVSEIAKSYGGGGHHNAAGFEELPFDRRVR